MCSYVCMCGCVLYIKAWIHTSTDAPRHTQPHVRWHTHAYADTQTHRHTDTQALQCVVCFERSMHNAINAFTNLNTTNTTSHLYVTNWSCYETLLFYTLRDFAFSLTSLKVWARCRRGHWATRHYLCIHEPKYHEPIESSICHEHRWTLRDITNSLSHVTSRTRWVGKTSRT